MMPLCAMCGEYVEQVTKCTVCGEKFCDVCGHPEDKLCIYCEDVDDDFNDDLDQ
ncbi:hypothetical protein ACFL0D_06615 [Thermoproteota archaeon]